MIIKTEDDVKQLLLTPGVKARDLCSIAASLVQSQSYFLALALYNKAYVIASKDEQVLAEYVDLLCTLNRHRDAYDLLIHAYTSINASAQVLQWLVQLNNLRPNNDEWIRRLANIDSVDQLEFVKLADLRQFCAEQKIKFECIENEQTLYLPKVNDFPPTHRDNFYGSYNAKSVYKAELSNVVVSAQSHAIFSEGFAIREEFGYMHRDDFVLNCALDKWVHYIPQTRSYTNTAIVYPRKISRKIETRCLNLVGSNSNNYYHWLIEWVPRVLSMQAEEGELSLLINRNIPQQFKDALLTATESRFPLIEIDADECVEVESLIHVVGWATVPCDVRSDKKPHINDVYVHPKAINWLIEKCDSFKSKVKPFRKIYLRRAKDAIRSFVNEAEVAELLKRHGFEFVMPENLSFAEQVKIFSEAKVVFGPTGAAFANIIFCQPGTHIIPMTMGEGNDADYSIFAKLSMLAGLETTHFLTNETGADHVYKWFATFGVDIELLDKFLQSLSIESDSKQLPSEVN